MKIHRVKEGENLKDIARSYGATERYIKAWNALNPGEFTENDSRTNQQRAFETICNYWLYKTPLNVSTPYGTFSNMYIQNADFVQDESETVSNISITLNGVLDNTIAS